MEKKCDICGKVFSANSWNQLRCSDNCKKLWLIDYNKKYHNEYYSKNSEYVKSKVKDYRQNNKEKYAEQKRNYFSKNKNKINKRLRDYKKERQKKDENYYLTRTLRRRIYMGIKKQFSEKAFKTIDLIGCSIPELKQHLESQFKDGMDWNNYGLKGWHIDHIKPCASFDLTNPEEQKKCFHYTNLQPLWAKDNLKKGAKIL
jgi:hypothetical protein